MKRNVYGSSVTDSHDLSWIGTAGIGVLLAPVEATEAGVKAALIAGHFVAYRGTISDDLPRVLEVIHDATNGILTVRIISMTAGTVQWITGGSSIVKQDVLPADVTLFSLHYNEQHMAERLNSYVRLEATNDLGTMYTQPFLLNCK